MTLFFQREIEGIKKKILSVAALVEENLQKALKALETRDADLAKNVIQDDEKIDRMEIEVEEECLKILALHQPVAIDLRYVISVLKINNDLERIGDLSENIADSAIYLSKRDPVEIANAIYEMGSAVQNMLEMSLDALINMDLKLADEVCAADQKVDDLHESMYKYVENVIAKNPQSVDSQLHLLAVSRSLERIADHTTNIAEDVMYMVNGEISRHQSD